MAQIQQ